MYINLAEGNSLSKIDMRAVWVGLFKTNWRGSLNINRLTNKTKDSLQYFFCFRGNLLTSKPSSWSPKHGNAMRLYGDCAPTINRANSSSCGEFQSSGTRSKVRVLGKTQEKIAVIIFSVKRKCRGEKHWYVVGAFNSEKQHSNSCKRVVPLLQWPMINNGDSWLGKDRKWRPMIISHKSANGNISVCKNAIKVVISTRPSLLVDIFFVLPFTRSTQVFNVIPNHKRGLRHGYLFMEWWFIESSLEKLYEG